VIVRAGDIYIRYVADSPHRDDSDQGLIVRFLTLDRDASYGDRPVEEVHADQLTVAAEIARRFGDEATDRLADYFTTHRYSPDEAIEMAQDDPTLVLKVARGE
jgi:hypothetical protein